MRLWGALCIGVASTIGGGAGFGTALISTPLLLLVGFPVPEVVVISLAASLVTRVVVIMRLREHITWRRVALLGLGSIPGAWLGAETVNVLPEHYLKLAAGLLVVLCGMRLAIPSRTQRRTPTATAELVTGAVGGFLSTTTSLNGPPPVLLFSRARIPPLPFIADLAGYFVVTNTLSLAILWFRSELPQAVLGPVLPACVTAALIGNLTGLRVARRLPATVFRSSVIALVIIAGVLTVVTA